MSWKNWPSWLKGGVIGAGIAILIIILNLFLSYLLVKLSQAQVLTFRDPFYWKLDSFRNFLAGLGPTGLIIYILMFFSYLFFGYFEEHAAVYAYVYFITFPIILFLIGAFIGSRIGKIKRRLLILGIVFVITTPYILSRFAVLLHVPYITLGLIIWIFVLAFIIKSLFEKNKIKSKSKKAVKSKKK